MAIQTSFVKRSREAKKNAGVALIAMDLAKKNNDPLWVKSNKAKKLFIFAKQAINKRYKQQAVIAWQKQENLKNSNPIENSK